MNNQEAVMPKTGAWGERNDEVIAKANAAKAEVAEGLAEQKQEITGTVPEEKGAVAGEIAGEGEEQGRG
jgi:hypothetical protein